MFLTTHKDPYKYYTEVLKSSIKPIFGNNEELCEKKCKQLLEAFEREYQDLPPVTIKPNDPERLVRLAIYIWERVVKISLGTCIKDNYGKDSFTPLVAIGYYEYDIENAYINKNKPYKIPAVSYYNDIKELFYHTIVDKNSMAKLTEPDTFGNYQVIDFENFSKSLKREIRNYYYQHPDLKNSVSQDENVQQIFGQILSKLTKSLVSNKKQYQDELFEF